jgi:hypothetical protein
MDGVSVHYARTIEDVLDVALPQLRARHVAVASTEEQPVSAAA